ncbi:MAG TPA: hypothetical protein VK083_21245 [Nocardia sp.]|uniref:hypothetical protein n=1 Tax=Nocardia sp. TaxID=1821 RepID=UPI002B4AFA06|nr:hypothetical protein [Nocardia sp.]HLS79315.1 hypothetical protein [Nocardia sp.]
MPDSDTDDPSDRAAERDATAAQAGAAGAGDPDARGRDPAVGIAELEPLVARWNPQGTALLRALRTPGAAADEVALVAPAGVGTTLLRTELARLSPRVALTDALTDATAVETTLGSSATPPAAALVLLDAGSVIGADAIGLIGRLRAAGTTVVLAIDNIHAHADWREVRERDRAVLAANGYPEADILPVSARLAAAARTGDSALLDRSGLTALHAALVTATAGGAADDGQARAAVLTRVVTETRDRVAEQMAALRGDTEIARWRAERAALLAARDGGRAAAMSTLRGRLHLARVDLMTETGAQVRALHATARAEIDRAPRAELPDYPLRLQQAVTDLTAVVDRALDHRIGEIGRRVDTAVPPAATGDVRAPGESPVVPRAGVHGESGPRPTEVLGQGTEVLDARSTPARGRGREPAPRVGPDPEPRPTGVEDHLMVALGASAGAGLGRLLVSPLSLVPALEVASVPVTLALGGLVAWWVVRARRQVADRAHLRQWVAEALVTVKAQLEQRVATALVETETALTEQVMRTCAQRVVDNDRRVAELEARIRRAAAERPGQLAACERDIALLEQYLANRGR